MNLSSLKSSLVSMLPRAAHRLLLRAGQGAYLLRQRWFDPPAGCSIIVENDVGDVLLVKHSYRHKGIWMLPSGSMGKREPPVEAAKRELHEEVKCILDGAVLVEFEDVEWLGIRYRMVVVGGGTRRQPIADLREIEEAAFFPVAALPEPIETASLKRIQRWGLRKSLPIQVPPFIRLEYAAANF